MLPVTAEKFDILNGRKGLKFSLKINEL